MNKILFNLSLLIIFVLSVTSLSLSHRLTKAESLLFSMRSVWSTHNNHATITDADGRKVIEWMDEVDKLRINPKEYKSLKVE